MSYDLLIYEREFLRDAVERSLGDWTTAPSLAEAACAILVSRVLAAGFVENPQDPGFVAFARAQGHKVGREFACSSAACAAQFTLFESSAAFVVAPGAPTESVGFCTALARRMVEEACLGLFDPQTGEVVA